MLKSSALYRLLGLSDRRVESMFVACEAACTFQEIPSEQGGEDSPPGVQVRHAASELVPSQDQEAAGVIDGCSALLLTSIFIIDEQLGPVWKISFIPLPLSRF